MTDDLSPRFFLRMDFPNGRKLGPGKITLLEAVRDHGSILAGAKAIGMSYRRAWLLMEELAHMFEEPVVISYPGRRGHGTELTPFGSRLIALYRAMEQRTARSLRASAAELTAALRRDPSAAIPGADEEDDPEFRAKAG